MWEYRLMWPNAAPSWWDDTFETGEVLLQRQNQMAEGRPDTYLVLPDRPDVGLKLRGGAEDEFEMKVRHSRKDGWELWEKIIFFRWNKIEARRFAAALQRDLPMDGVSSESTPAMGVKKILAGAGIEATLQRIEKRRMQARADELLPKFANATQPLWLAELVEFRTQKNDCVVRSVCLETMSPDAVPLEAEDALCMGYPEFLIRCRNAF